jgi:hypothetical protein
MFICGSTKRTAGSAAGTSGSDAFLSASLAFPVVALTDRNFCHFGACRRNPSHDMLRRLLISLPSVHAMIAAEMLR